MARKGFFAFLIVIFIAISILAFKIASNDIAKNVSSASVVALSIESRAELDLEVKEAIAQLLGETNSFETSLDSAIFVSKRLSDFEEYIEDKLKERGILADVWIGNLNIGEADYLNNRARQFKRPFKCQNCIDLSVDVPIRTKDGLAFAKSGIFLVDCSKISRCFLSKSALGSNFIDSDSFSNILLKTFFDALSFQTSGTMGIGVSAYFEKEGLATIIMIPIGFNSKELGF